MSEMSEEERQEAIEHRDVLLDIRSMLVLDSGLKFFKYLFKNLEVGEVPELGVEGNFLHDKLGFLRAGNSIFKLVCEADYEVSAKILAAIEKEKYERLNQSTSDSSGQ